MDTYTVQSSPGKAHFYFRRAGLQLKNLELGIGSLRAENQYVAAAGSIHPKTGQPYTVINDAAVADLTPGLLRELEEIAAGVTREVQRVVVDWDGKKKIPEGMRQYFLRSQVGKLWDGKKDEEQLFAELSELNQKFCEPPKDDYKVRELVRWVMKKEPNDPGPKVNVYVDGKDPNGNVDPDSWRSLFHTYEEAITAPPLKFAIQGFLQEEGITMLGGLAGHGKTLIMLNVVKALLEGDLLFGYEGFTVSRPSKRVVYLVPESGLGPFVHRLKLFRLLEHVKSDRLLFRTLSASGDLSLTDPRVQRVVEGADVFLDTAIRFMDGDENSASDQKAFAKTLFDLQRCGARTIVGAHHSPKAFGNSESINLENALRGSGDVGAMLCTAWAVRQTDEAKNEIHVRNVKARDFIPCGAFRLTGRPHIDQQGSFAMTTVPGEAEAPKVERLNRKAGQQEEARVMLAAGHTVEAVAKHLKVTERTIYRWKDSGILT